nr:Cna B-type domain-containing protein [Enterococcus alcedinis]
MLIVLFTQTLTPVVTVFAEDLTKDTESSSDIRVETQSATLSNNDIENVVQSSTNTFETSQSTIVSTEITNESTTVEPSTESGEATTEETGEATEATTEEDEEPARESTDTTKKSSPSVQNQETVEDILQLLTGVTAQIQIDGKWQPFNHQGSVTVDPELLGGLILHYEFKQVPNDIELEADKVYEIILPNIVKVSETKTWQNEDENITFELTVDGKLNIVFSENFVTKDQREFTAEINLAIDRTVFEEERYQKVEIGYGDNKIFESEIIGDNDKYEGEDNKKGFTYILEEDVKRETTIRPTHADWTVTVNSGINRYESAKIQDTIGEGHTLVAGSIVVTKVIRNKVTGEILDRETVDVPKDAIQVNGQSFTVDIGDINDTYEVSYTTLITEGQPGTENKIKNNTVIILDGDETKVNEELDVSWGKEYPTIKKTSPSVDGKYINWEINYNYANEDFGVDPLILTDKLSEGSYFDLKDLGLNIQEVSLDREGNPVYGESVTIEPTLNEQGHLILSIPNAKGKGYKITYRSILKGDLNGVTIKNEVTVNDPDKSTDSAEQVVTTTPSLNKSSKVVYEGGKAYIDWTIVFNEKGYAFDKLTLVDTYNTKHLTLLEETIKVNDAVLAENMTFKRTDQDFTLTIEPAAAQPYILTYRTEVTESGLKEGLSNKVNVDWGDGHGVETGEVKPGEIKPGVTKEGKYSMVEDENRQKIDWKITFNNNKLILNKPVLTDTFNPADLEVIDDVVIKIGDRVVETGKYTYDKTPDGFTVTFKENTEPEIYTIEYSTNAPDASNANSVNTATLKWQGKEDTAESTVSKRTPGVNKTGETIVAEDGTKQNKWEVKFNTNKHVIYDLVLTDTFTPETSTLVGGLEGVSIKVGSTDLKAGTDYTIAFAEGKTNQFVVKFSKETEPVVYTMTYATTYTPIDEMQNAVNSIDLVFRGGTESTDKTIAKPTLNVEKKVTGLNKKSDPKILSWQINANPGKEAKNRVSLFDAKLIDEILADQAYVDGSMKIVRSDQPETDLDVKKLVTWKDSTFTISLPDGPYEYIVTYDTAIVAYPSMNPNEAGKYDRYYNEVSLTNQPDPTKDPEKAIAHAYKDYFDDGSNNNAEKSGEQNPDTDNIDWTVKINPAGLPIRDAKIVDTLDEYQEYLEDSVILSLGELKLKKGTDYSIEFGEDKAGNKTFTIILNERKETPEEVEAGISYNYQLSYSTRLRDGAVGIFEVQNEFSISGLVNAGWTETVTTSTSAEKWTYGGSGSGVQLSLEGKKVDADRPDVALEGVKFNLSRITGSNPEIKKPAPGELITNADGVIAVKEIRSGRYILEETQAKPGYETIPSIHFILGYDQNKNKLITLTDSNWKATENPNVSVEEGKLVIRNTQITRAILANKIWSDNSPQQKPTIWFTLFSRTKATKAGSARIADSTQELLSGEENVSWDDLPTHNDAGDILEYYVKETDIDGTLLIPEYYEQTGDGLTLTNHFIEKTVEWKATKIWEDYGNKHLTRPESIYLQLLQDGQAHGEIVELVGSKFLNMWEHTFDKLPQVNMITGEAYVYTVQEVDEQGTPIEQLGDYDVTSDEQTVTNTLRNVTELHGEKVWDDFDDQDQVRPASVTINLLQNDKKIKETTITNEEDWAFSFTDLVKYDQDGNLYDYRVTEETVPGYTPSIDGTTITNSYRGNVEVAGTKTWKDGNNKFDSRPTTITVQLLQNTKPIDEQIIGENEEWHYAFTDLAKYDENGEPYVYTVAEVSVNGYESTIIQTLEAIEGEIRFNLINHLVTTDVQVDKVWDDFDNQYNLRPASIQVSLLQNGEPLESVEPATIEPDETGNWQHRFTNLPKFDSEGKEYHYTIEEVAVPGYESTIIQTLEAVEGEIRFNLINQLATVDMPISKEWSDNNDQYGLRPDSITVRLLQNGKEIESAPAIEVNAKNNWQSEFTNLPKFDADGQPFEYILSEDTVTGYEASINQATGVITNQLLTTNLIGEKLWEDWNNQRNQRPESITVNLLQGDRVIETLEVKPDTTGKWHFSFDNLPKLNAKGEAFEYSVTENEVENYRATIEQEGNTVTITNQYFSRLPGTGGGKEENSGGKLPNTGGGSQKPQPVQPTTPKKSLPQTGEQVNPLLSIMGVLLVAMTLTIGFYKRRKKQ